MNIEIANRLYAYRKANGYSQEELAAKIGVSRQAISKWERSESSPDTDNLIALAKLYNVSLDEMINGDSTPTKAKEPKKEDEPVTETQPEETQAPADKVNISLHGVDVQSKDGDSVHIGLDGINVNSNTAQPVNDHIFTNFETGKKKAPWISAAIWLFGFILFFLVGAVFPSGWSVSWIILLLLPAIDTGIDAIVQNDANKFAYPLLVTALFCALGMGFGLWHPAWVLFLSIPVYYIVIDGIKKSRQPSQERSSLFITFAVIFAIAMCSTLGIVGNTAMQGRSNRNSAAASIGNMFNYENESAYSIGGASVSATEINSLSVDWVNGSITINPSTDGSDTITFSEIGQTNEDLTLRYLVDNGTLKIKFCKSHTTIKSLKNLNKDLMITVPQKVWSELDIDSVSAEININSQTASKLEIDNVSGLITAKGEFKNIDIDNVSGNAVISNTASNGSYDIDTVSGDFTLAFPQNISGFAVNYDSVSGDVNAEGFDAVTNTKEKTVTYGDRAVNIDLDTVSGDLILKAE